MFGLISSFLGRKKPEEQALSAYRTIVTQARQPGFYRELGVPDNLDGRFDMIVLHAFLAMRRFGRIEPGGQELSQALFDLLFADMDSNLREIGVGDLSVGKKVKAMAQAFYGRVGAYEAGLHAPEPEALENALARNLYARANPGPAALTAMATYLREADAALAGQADQDLLAGKLEFPPFRA